MKRGGPRPAAGYSYERFCRNVAAIHGNACWVRRTLGAREPLVSTRLLRCDGIMDGHHLGLPKQTLRREFQHGVWLDHRDVWQKMPRWAAARFDVENAHTMRSLGELLNDGRNGIPACRLHHDQLEHAVIRLAREELPAEVEEFAAELGFGWFLTRSFGAPIHYGPPAPPAERVPVLDYDDPASPVYEEGGSR